jgi:hypothetical protein
MRLQTDRKIEIVRVIRTGDHAYADAPDPESTEHYAPAINEGTDFAPDFEAKPGDLLLIKVLE